MAKELAAPGRKSGSGDGEKRWQMRTVIWNYKKNSSGLRRADTWLGNHWMNTHCHVPTIVENLSSDKRGLCEENEAEHRVSSRQIGAIKAGGTGGEQ